MASALALHFARGRYMWRAVRYWRHATEQAMQRSAYPETLAHCQQGLASLETLLETPERMRRELALRTCLDAVLTAMHGYISPEREQNLQRALTLCQDLEATTGGPAMRSPFLGMAPYLEAADIWPDFHQ